MIKTGKARQDRLVGNGRVVASKEPIARNPMGVCRNRLPSEIRNAIYHMCNTPKALHTFASYSDNSRRIVLHFEHFVCDGDGTYCLRSGCLHQVYVSAGGHYRLVRSYYAPN